MPTLGGFTRVFAAFVFASWAGAAWCQDPATATASEPAETQESAHRSLLHGRVIDALDAEQDALARLLGEELGLAFGEDEGDWYVNIWLRAQTRWSDPFDSDPLTVAAVESPPGVDLELRRARIKTEGHLFRPWLGFYFEHELTGEHPLLDLRLDIAPRDDLELRIGQYKVLYNRERVDSSGRQQFVERSIATYAFTLDRQRGASVMKHVAKGTRGDSWFMAGVFEGDGRDPGPSGDDPLWVGRWQWQFLGRALPFRQGDFEISEKPLGSFSLAAARVRGPYTRFSSSGGGQLDGFEAGGDERYTLEQWQQGFAWKYRGWSVQQEYHEKRVTDHEAGLRSRLSGGYEQVGKAWPVQLGGSARAVEVALRHARVRWRDTPLDRTQLEWTAVFNLYLDGHDNKFNFEAGWLDVDERGGPEADDIRLRVQWDVSF